MTVPVDHDARVRIHHEHSLTCFVEAGAGTGKTTALVERVVEMFAQGHAAPRELAAITFTEAAASELRERIRLALESARVGAENPEQRTRLDDALMHLDEAHVSTIHAFAQAILAEHAIAAGLPPRFDVIDELEAEIDFDAAWQRFYAELLDDERYEDALATGYVLGLNRWHLRNVTQALHDNYHRLAEWTPPPAVPATFDLAAFRTSVRAVCAMASNCSDPNDLLRIHIEDNITAIATTLDAMQGDDPLTMLELLMELPRFAVARNGGRKDAWGGDAKAVRDACKALDAELAERLGAVRRWVLNALLPELCTFALGVVRDRWAEGRLQFHDLLVAARDLLRDHADARRLASERYRVVLIDEFQDTDPLQAELTVLLAAGASATVPWTEARVDPGRLFFVGDPKQSIYRFRHADLLVYRATHEAHAQVTLELTENWRSVPAVIDWVNKVFGRLMPSDGPQQAPFRALHAARPALDHPSPAVGVFGAAHHEPMAEIRLAEAGDVAALAATVLADEWPVGDRNGQRRARFSDIAILLPTRALLPALETALDHAGVPARVESRSLVFSTAEVRDLTTILSAIDDPTDAIAVVGALRTPFFGVSDRELVEYSQAGGRFDPRRAAPERIDPHHAVAVALARLHEWYERRWWKSVSETLADVVRDLEVFATLTAHQRPRDHWRRVRFLQEQARAFVDADAGDLRAFVEWVARQREEGAASVEDAVPDPDDDAVRILTVHGAKGLEFPVVILAGINVDPPNRSLPVLWTADGPEFRVGRRVDNVGHYFETPGYADASTANAEADAAEATRLLYVATTRARDHLLVSLHRRERSSRNAAARLAPIADALDTPVLTPELPNVAVAPAVTCDTAAAAALVATRGEWASTRRAQLDALRHDQVVTPTDLARRLADELPTPTGTDETTERAVSIEPMAGTDGPPWRRGRGGTALGRAVHAVLQDAAPGMSISALARAAATAEGLPAAAADIERRAIGALDTPIVRTAFAMPQVRREVPISVPVDGILVEGVIDLLAFDDNRLVIVDYKTDAVTSAAAWQAARDRYAPQLAAYACALEVLLGRPVTDAYLVFADAKEASELRIDTLAEEMARVRAVLTAR